MVSTGSRAPSRPPMPSWWLWAMAHGKEDRMKSAQETTEEILAGIRDPELRQAAAGLKRAMDNNPRDVPEDVSEPQTPKIIQLPPWQEAKRGVPNSILRGALFASIQGQHRRYMKGELLAAQQDIEIRFTGMQLDQSDLDVWELALHRARKHPLGTRCYFTAYGFLKALGRRTSGSDLEWLKGVFRRLAGAVIEITHRRMSYFGGLLDGGMRDEDTGRYVLEIDPRIIALFDAGWTATDWEQRAQLRRKELALWLHGYYSTHAAPHPVSVEYLHRISGSRDRSMRSYKQRLIKAHEKLQEVGAIEDFEIRNGLVFIDNVPSDSQKRRLSRASRRHK